jgi:argininosuccinate lyase
VLWVSPGFALIKLSDRFTTGSSIMPQKRNPDAAELSRAKAGRIIGALTALLVVIKGLPLAYSKDMQEDKEPVFDALDSLALAIAATSAMVRDLEPNAAAMRKMAGAAYSTATDLADWLVRAAGLPFREAHAVTGRIVKAAEARGVPLHKLTLAEMQAIDERVSEAVYTVLGVDRSVGSRTSLGGTAPRNVRREARRWLARIAKEGQKRAR